MKTNIEVTETFESGKKVLIVISEIGLLVAKIKDLLELNEKDAVESNWFDERFRESLIDGGRRVGKSSSIRQALVDMDKLNGAKATQIWFDEAHIFKMDIWEELSKAEPLSFQFPKDPPKTFRTTHGPQIHMNRKSMLRKGKMA